MKYQELVDIGYARAVQQFDAGKLSPKLGREEAIGSLMDEYARVHLKRWYASEGIAEGPKGIVQVNRRLNGQGERYRVPDLRIGDMIYDASLTAKSHTFSQVKDFFTFGKPRGVTIVRPGAVGPSYSVTPK